MIVKTIIVILFGQIFCPVLLLKGCRSPQSVRNHSEGSYAVFGEFPWTLGLVYSEKFTFCAASLIHPKVALTSATCVRLYRAYEKEDENPVVRAGEWFIFRPIEELPHQDQRIVNSIFHPDYAEDTSVDDVASLILLPVQANDVALIIFEKEFKLDKNVGLICLNKLGANMGKKCLISGWGKTDRGRSMPEPFMQRIEVNIEPDNLCADRVKEITEFNESFLCTKPLRRSLDTCAGFNGAPMICFDEEQDMYVQSGIFTRRVFCGSDRPSLTSNVSFFYDWIEVKLKENNISLY